MSPRKIFKLLPLIYLIFGISIFIITAVLNRSDTIGLFILFNVSFFAYVWICKFEFSFKSILILGIIVRCSLFYDLPNLSDDFYRFFWDGALIHEGINPYSFLPKQVTEMGLSKFSHKTLAQLNSSNYATVYPPLNQFFFWLSTFTVEPLWSAGILRIFLFLSDIFSTLFVVWG